MQIEQNYLILEFQFGSIYGLERNMGRGRGWWHGRECVKVNLLFSRKTRLQSERRNPSVSLDCKYRGLHRSLQLGEIGANRFPDNRQGSQPYASAVFTPKYIPRHHLLEINLLAPELFFLILAHPVYKM